MVTLSLLVSTIATAIFRATLSLLMYLYVSQAQLAPVGTMSWPPPAPRLWSEILTASPKNLSMKGQLFPALRRLA